MDWLIAGLPLYCSVIHLRNDTQHFDNKHLNSVSDKNLNEPIKFEFTNLQLCDWQINAKIWNNLTRRQKVIVK